MDQVATHREATGGSPTKSAQEVLRRMSLNSPPSRSDNPRQVKRAKLLAGERGIGGGDLQPGAQRHRTRNASSSVVPAQTPLKHQQRQFSRVALEVASPMPSWGRSKGMALREASYGESLEASEPSSLYPSFELDCLRQPYGSSSPSPPASRCGDASPSMEGDDDTFPEELSPSKLAPQHRNARDVAMGGRTVPDTPLRRPGSVARSRMSELGAASGVIAGRRRGESGSCSPVRNYDDGGASGSAAQGSPVKKRGVGRLRLSCGGGNGGSGFGSGGGSMSSPKSNRNPFSPSMVTASAVKGTRSMPAPAPRTATRPSGKDSREAGDSSPMDTGEVDFGAIAEGLSSGKGDDGSFLRRVSAGSCVSVPETGGGLRKSPDDITKPSPCDVAEFVPITPYRDGLPGLGGSGVPGGDMTPSSPIPEIGADAFVSGGKFGGIGGIRAKKIGARGELALGIDRRGRFATDFEELDVIGTGCFGTVYKVRSRVDGCLYAVKCTRRPFRGEADRQNMLREVYALAAVCDAQDTINIVRYHQAWIEDERLYIQTELCETCLEKQMENGQRFDIPGVYAFLRQTLLGLEILHRHKLVHLDIKPGNIFVKNGQYKLGDFGLVTSLNVGSGADVVEGDSRYMSKDLLNEDYSDLTKCDVFSLGITVYEMISGRPLPPNGDEWHRLRCGRAGMPMGLPADLSQIVTEMMQPEPSRRPSAAELLRYPCLQSEMERQLNDHRSELNKERTHNQALKQEVSALIHKQNQRNGRLSRTVTWDNSFFSKSDSSLLMRKYDGVDTSGVVTRGIAATTDMFSESIGSRINPDLFGTRSSAPKFGGGAGERGGVVGQGLSSVAEEPKTPPDASGR